MAGFPRRFGVLWTLWLPSARSFQQPLKRTTSRLSSTASDDELPHDLPFRDDVRVALAAVRRACKVTQALQPSGDAASIATVEKADLSPVTVADFAVQAQILDALHNEFPPDGFIAEEDSRSLLQDEDLRHQVAQAAGLKNDDLLLSIDLGKSYQTWENQRPERVWCLDPIDGTRGFLRGKQAGGQYAIALALVKDGQPVVGVLGCPNLPVAADDSNFAWTAKEKAKMKADDPLNQASTRGCLFVASKGGGCYQLPLEPDDQATGPPQRLQVTSEAALSTQDARFCIGVEKYSDALGQCAGMAAEMHGGVERALTDDGEIARARRMDSQAKHGLIARGGAELYVRLPKPGYVEWIWDHAAGNVVIEEAGGTMTDTAGRPIDFSLGAQLSADVRGVLMSAGGSFHKELVDAYAAVADAKA